MYLTKILPKLLSFLLPTTLKNEFNMATFEVKYWIFTYSVYNSGNVFLIFFKFCI